MKKRLIILSLACILLIGALTACSSKNKDDSKEEDPYKDALTRREWAVMLAEAYGYDSYFEEEPYYSDINAEDKDFAYIQSLYEWKVISQGVEKFKPDDKATLGFVLCSTVLGAELEYYDYSGVTQNDMMINCAVENGLYDGKTDDKALRTPLTKEAAKKILEASKKLDSF